MTENVERPVLCYQQLMPGRLQVAESGFETALGLESVYGLELFQGCDQLSQIGGAAGMYDVQVKGIQRNALKNGADAADHYKFNFVTTQNAKDFPKPDLRHLTLTDASGLKGSP